MEKRRFKKKKVGTIQHKINMTRIQIYKMHSSYKKYKTKKYNTKKYKNTKIQYKKIQNKNVLFSFSSAMPCVSPRLLYVHKEVYPMGNIHQIIIDPKK